MFDKARELAQSLEKEESFTQYFEGAIEQTNLLDKQQKKRTLKETMMERLNTAGDWKGKLGRIFNDFPPLKDTLNHPNNFLLDQFYALTDLIIDEINDSSTLNDQASISLMEKIEKTINTHTENFSHKNKVSPVEKSITEIGDFFAYFSCHYLLSPKGILKPEIEDAIYKSIGNDLKETIDKSLNEKERTAAIVTCFMGQIISANFELSLYTKLKEKLNIKFPHDQEYISSFALSIKTILLKTLNKTDNYIKNYSIMQNLNQENLRNNLNTIATPKERLDHIQKVFLAIKPSTNKNISKNTLEHIKMLKKVYEEVLINSPLNESEKKIYIQDKNNIINFKPNSIFSLPTKTGTHQRIKEHQEKLSNKSQDCLDKDTFVTHIEAINNKELKDLLKNCIEKCVSIRFPTQDQTHKFIENINKSLKHPKGLDRKIYLNTILEASKTNGVFSTFVIPKEDFPKEGFKATNILEIAPKNYPEDSKNLSYKKNTQNIVMGGHRDKKIDENPIIGQHRRPGTK